MKCKNYQLTPKNRRGLSSVVGALLFVVLMVATFSVLGVALDSQTKIVDTGREVADKDLKQQQEEFTMNAFTTGPNGTATLSVNVNNLGQNPTEIFTLIVTDTQNATAGFPVDVYDIPADGSFVMPGETENILATTTPSINLTLPIIANETKVFTFKTISSLGTIALDSVICDNNGCADPVTPAGEGALAATLFLDGPNGVNTKTSTIVMFVTNTSEETVTDVKPINGFDGDPNCLNFWEVNVTGVTVDNGITENITNCSVTPNTSQTLGPHATTLFIWDVTVGGDIGAEFEFCNSVTGDDGTPPLLTSTNPQNCDLALPVENGAFDSLTVIDPNDCDGCGPGGEGSPTIILIDDLLIRPSIFMIIPSPFGIPNQPGGGSEKYKGLWGINVVNPTEKPMSVSKLTIAAYPPGSTPGDLVVEGDDDKCVIQDVSPGDLFNPNPVSEGGTFRGAWSCPRINVMMWQNFSNPIPIDPFSSVAFLANVKPGSISAGDSLDAVIVQANVFSSSGSFGKAAYQTTMYQANPDGGIVNVYLTADDPDPRADLISQRLGIPFNSTETFKIVFADMDDDDATSIEAGAKLIVNVPREWKFVTVTNSTGFITNATQPSVVEHADSSTQIIALIDSPIGGPGDPVAKILTFTTEAPDISKDGIIRLYIMYVLGDGLTETGASRAVGPLNEIVLQVLP